MVDLLNPLIQTECAACGMWHVQKCHRDTNDEMSFIWQLILFYIISPRIPDSLIKMKLRVFVAKISFTATVDMLTDMFCSNQWADRKQVKEIARVQGCSEERLQACFHTP